MTEDQNTGHELRTLRELREFDRAEIDRLNRKVIRLAEDNHRLRVSITLLSHEPADVTIACQGRHGDMSRKTILRLLPHMVPRSKLTEALAELAQVRAKLAALGPEDVSPYASPYWQTWSTST